ncbi:Glyoxylate/hydroxypyruvate reductase [Saliniradius amylolyticus]|uniref:Glyoxylate/hydroxypyruvate reductase n=1 Tax=Saliniradius amylolyticus TaxID=2183582 RepID=A0A2S2DZZ6_9ALTE|nr:D-2-hydroxyacid dehydrogenase [Saliniradius amylolyticus]AWL10968.1 Glyoxylate/hydroxypyruvate reductase [Saliniradius amylolyticus]
MVKPEPIELAVLSQRYQEYHPHLDLPEAGCQILLADPDLAATALNRLPKVQWIQSTWAGVRPLLNHNRRNYQLTGIKDVFGVQIREYVLTYLLYFTRQVPEYLSKQKRQCWQPESPKTLAGQTLGILGAGNIGTDVARAASGLGMRVVGLTRSGQCKDVFEQCYAPAQRLEMTAQCDHLVSLLPQTPDTTNLINAELLRQLPRHGVIINAGRGNVIHQQALIDSLTNKQIRGAVLDVFEQEPLPDCHPFWHTPNLIVTQHTAGVSFPKDIAKLFLNNLRHWREGQPLLHRIDFAKGY